MDSARGWVAPFVAALLVLATAALPGSAVAMRGSGDLSPRLAKLAGASLRDAPPATQAKALGLAPDGLARRGRRLLVDVRFAGGALAARDELREAGAAIVAASRRYQTLTIATGPARLRAIAAAPGVEGVTPVLAPVATAVCPSGSVVSEGDEQLEALEARETKGVDGTGVTVGILSDSFDQAIVDGDGEPIATHAEDDVKSADLPGTGNECGHTTPVDVLSEESNAAAASDEGRAMAQIVHDLAPGAELKFSSAFNGEISFANNIRELGETPGADVIADDVFYPGEPFFQDGPIAVAVRDVVEGGATYFSAAGNNNLIDGEGNDIASWETPGYRDAGSCPPAIQAIPGAKALHCLDFDPGLAVDRTFGIKVKPGATLALDLQWDEPWNGVETDLDAFLLDAAGNRIPGAESHEDNVEISQTPVEVLEWANSSGGTRTVQLVVNRFSEGNAPRVKFALIQNGGGVSATEYPHSSGEDVVGPTIFGHSGAAAAISTGAVFFGDKAELERYSSRGPVRHDFGPVEGPSAAPPLGVPETLSKPDMVATDCGKTTFFSFFVDEFDAWHFCGTSAAAPHAAAVAALMLEAEPAAEPDDIRAALVASAVEVGAFGPCDVGAGLVEAVGAIDEALAQTGAAGPPCEPPESEVDPEEAAASGDWGSEVPPTPPVVPPTTSPPPPQPEAKEPEPVVLPRTFFLQRPAKVIRTQTRAARAVFLFGSDVDGVSFVCRIDGGLFRPCAERLARRFPLGWHTIKVAALDAEGNGDKTPAGYRFKIRKVR